MLLLAGWARWSASLKKNPCDLKLPIVPVMRGRPVFFCVPKSRPSHPYMNSLFLIFSEFLYFFVQLYRIIGEVVFGKEKCVFSVLVHMPS